MHIRKPIARHGMETTLFLRKSSPSLGVDTRTGWLPVLGAEGLSFIANLKGKLETRKRTDVLYSGSSAHFGVLSPVSIFLIKQLQALLGSNTQVAIAENV